MIVGIDASNIRGGGGHTYLIELLSHAQPSKAKIDKVFLWGSKDTLSLIKDTPWLIKDHQPQLDQNLLSRSLWQANILPQKLKEYNCNLLFVPGGRAPCKFSPMVALSTNLLPFEWKEFTRFGFSLSVLKFLFLRHMQSKTFRKADGVIFLSDYAKNTICNLNPTITQNSSIISFGIDQRFSPITRSIAPITRYTEDNPFKILYVSKINVYKHQWNVVEAVARLKTKGVPIQLDLVGPAYRPSLKKLEQAIAKYDPHGQCINYRGAIPFETLHIAYQQADLFVFASSCENLPNILLEAMASGLPIVCSNRGPMPEVLQDAGHYFDPENPEDIAKGILSLVNDHQLRESLASKSVKLAEKFSWSRCADETFSFFESTIESHSLIN